ncbi:hypothetical protein VTK26DRAFT_8857 [Humicola hyalothermophila]
MRRCTRTQEGSRRHFEWIRAFFDSACSDERPRARNLPCSSLPSRRLFSRVDGLAWTLPALVREKPPALRRTHRLRFLGVASL